MGGRVGGWGCAGVPPLRQLAAGVEGGVCVRAHARTYVCVCMCGGSRRGRSAWGGSFRGAATCPARLTPPWATRERFGPGLLMPPGHALLDILLYSKCTYSLTLLLAAAPARPAVQRIEVRAGSGSPSSARLRLPARPDSTLSFASLPLLLHPEGSDSPRGGQAATAGGYSVCRRTAGCTKHAGASGGVADSRAGEGPGGVAGRR